MPRDIDADFRAALEATSGEDQPLVFLTIDHADLDDPIRVVNDTGTVNGQAATWTYGGDTYIAFPFSLQLLTDTDEPPSAQIEIANVDREIGITLLALTGDIGVTFVVLLPSEFVTTTNPRTEIGTATPIYTATGLVLRAVEGDPISIRGTVTSIDDTQEPYPATRATKALLPGLWR